MTVVWRIIDYSSQQWGSDYPCDDNYILYTKLFEWHTLELIIHSVFNDALFVEYCILCCTDFSVDGGSAL